MTTSSVGRFQFQIRGKGVHAAKPEQGNDSVVVVGQLINSLQTIISRNLSAFDNAAVTIGEISCDNTWNVIADKAYIQGTVRSYSEDKRQYIEDRMKNIDDGLSQAFNFDIYFSYSRIPGAVVNDKYLTKLAIEVAKEVEYHVSILDEPLTIGEDFSGYTREYPGVFAFIGSNSKYDLHHPKYHPDERILEKSPNISYNSFNVY